VRRALSSPPVPTVGASSAAPLDVGVPLERLELPGAGVRLEALAAGPRDAPLVILLHGFPETAWCWRRQFAPLAAAGYRVVAPNQRGYGESDAPRAVRDYGLDPLAADLAALVGALGRERAHLVGHDWGGAVAWWLAATRPESIERLAVINVPHPSAMRRQLLRDPRQLARSWYIFFFQLPGLPERWLRRNLRRMLFATSRRGTFDEPLLALYEQAWSRPGAMRAMLAWYRAALRHPPGRPRLARVAAPTRILWGARDRALVAELVPASLRRCESGEVTWFERATHWVHHEEPEAVSAALLAHLGAPRPAAG
jgi:pimeloyl-ACP methyl ester carboxylesterase